MAGSGGSINIGSTFDVAELKAQIDSGADAVVAATRSMEGGFTHLESVSAALSKKIGQDTRELAQVIDISHTKAAIAAQKNASAQSELRAAMELVRRSAGSNAQDLAILAAAQQRAAVTAKVLAEAEIEAGVGAAALADNVHESVGAMALLSDEGIKINRHLRGFIADIPGVGSLFSKAFSALAIVGIVEVLTQVYDKIVSVSETLGGYTESVKKYEEQLVAENEKLLVSFKTVEQGKAVIENLNRELAEQPGFWKKMQDAETEFNTLTWKDMWALVAGPLYAVKKGYDSITESIGLSKDAEIRASKDRIAALEQLAKVNIQTEEHHVSQALAATKSGSAERIQILQDEIAKLGTNSSAWHDVVEKLQSDLTAAEREQHDQALATAKEASAKQVALAKSTFSEIIASQQQGSLERVNLLMLEDQRLRAMGKAYVEFEKEVHKELIAAKRELVNNLVAEDDREAKERTRLVEASLQDIIKENDKEIKENERKLQRNKELLDEMLDAYTSAANGRLEKEKATLDFEVALGQISEQKKLQMLRQFEQETYDSDRAILVEKQKAHQDDEKLFTQYGKQIQKLDDDFSKSQMENARKVALLKRQVFLDFFHSVDQNIKTSINGWLQRTQTFSQTMGKIWQSIALSAAESIEEIGLKWLEKHVFMRAVSAIFHIQEQTQQVAADAAEIGTHVAKNEAMIISDSGLAAANAYAAYAAFPPVAAAMAAAAAATVLSFGSVAAFEQGGIVPSTGLALVHKNERIVPEDISTRIMNTGPSGSGVGGHTINLSYAPQVSSFDGHHAQSVIDRHAPKIARVADKAIQRRLKKL